jgi:translocation and assembly module TamB
MRVITLLTQTAKMLLMTLALVISLAAALIGGGLSLFIYSESLPNKFWPYLAQWSDGLIQIESSEGRLANTLTLNQVRLQAPGLVMKADQLTLDWSLMALWRQSLTINQLKLNHLELHLEPQVEQTKSTQFVLPQAPFQVVRDLTISIKLRALNIEKLDIVSTQTQRIENLHLSFDWQASQLRLHQVSASYQDIQLSFNGNTHFVSDRRFEGRLTAHFSGLTEQTIATQIDWSGTLNDLSFTTRLQQPFSWRGEHHLHIQPESLSLDSQWQAAQWLIQPDLPLHIRSGQTKLQIQAVDQSLTLAGLADWQLADLPNLQQSFDAHLHDTDQLSLQIDTLVEGQQALFLQLDGDLTHKQAQINTEIRDFELNPWLNLESVPLIEANGRISLDIENWSQRKAQLNIHALDLHGLSKPLTISGRLNGAPNDQATQIHARPLAVQFGEHLGRIKVDMRLDPQGQIDIHSAKANLGANQLELSGTWPSQPSFKLNGQLNQLEQIWPNLKGRVELEAQVDLQQTLTVQFNAQRLIYQDWQIEQIKSQLSAPWQQWAWLEGEVQLKNLRQTTPTESQLLIEDLQIQRKRQAPGLVTNLQAKHPVAQLQTQWREVEPDLQNLNLQLDWLALETKHTGAWQLSKPTSFNWPPKDDSQIPVCLSSVEQPTANACFQPINEHSLNWSLQHWPLFDWLAPWMPEWVKADGRLSGKGHIDWQQDWTIEQTLLAEDWAVQVTQQGYQWPFALDDLTLNLSANPNQVNITAQGQVNQDGKLNIDVNLANHQAWSSADLKGQIDIQVNDWPLDQSLEALVKTKSVQLHFTSQLSGQIDQPQHQTGLNLKLLADLPILGLSDQRIEVKSRLNQKSVSLTGQWQQSLDKYADFNAQLSQLDSAPVLEGHIKSNSIQLLKTDFADIHSGADLSWSFAEQMLKLRGDVFLHDTLINFESMPLHQRTQVSSDEVILGEDGEPIQSQEAALQTDLDIQLHFQEDVRVQLLDIQALLGGQLRLVKAIDDKDMSGFGQVRLESGWVKLDERNQIQIDRSLFNFNGALNNPNLNVTLSRQVEQTTARLNITGNATQPQFVFYSTPPLSQGQVINLMIFGRAVDLEREPNYQSQVVSAFYKLGLQNNAPVLNQLTRTLGVEDVYFDIQDPQTSNLILGRALTDKLYIRYALGLGAQRSNSVQMFYQLRPNLFFESQSSDDSRSLDLIFRKER